MIGVHCLSAGEHRVHYVHSFDDDRDRFLARLDDPWDRTSISIVSRTEADESFVSPLSNATNPGAYFFRDGSGGIVSIARRGADIDRASLSPVRSVRVASPDGVEIEAFISMPAKASGPAPLVVMPHGGPIGVHDVREYDPVVQYPSALGLRRPAGQRFRKKPSPCSRRPSAASRPSGTSSSRSRRPTRRARCGPRS